MKRDKCGACKKDGAAKVVELAIHFTWPRAYVKMVCPCGREWVVGERARYEATLVYVFLGEGRWPFRVWHDQCDKAAACLLEQHRARKEIG